jgi:hypothetical protein
MGGADDARSHDEIARSTTATTTAVGGADAGFSQFSFLLNAPNDERGRLV